MLLNELHIKYKTSSERTDYQDRSVEGIKVRWSVDPFKCHSYYNNPCPMLKTGLPIILSNPMARIIWIDTLKGSTSDDPSTVLQSFPRQQPIFSSKTIEMRKKIWKKQKINEHKKRLYLGSSHKSCSIIFS